MTVPYSSLLAVERQQRIREILEAEGVVRSTELAQLLNVSVVTIRSDLRELEQQHVCETIHGGAIAPKKIIDQENILLHKRAELNADEKRRIGAYAASLVEDGMTIIVDAGSTAVQMIDQLPPDLRFVRIITPALNVAALAAPYPHIELVMTGGVLRGLTHSLIGSSVVRGIQQFHADIVFLGSAGWNVENGLTTGQMSEYEVKRVMLDQADRKILVSDSSKFGKRAPIHIADLTEIDLLITDTKLTNSEAHKIISCGTDVIRV